MQNSADNLENIIRKKKKEKFDQRILSVILHKGLGMNFIANIADCIMPSTLFCLNFFF